MKSQNLIKTVILFVCPFVADAGEGQTPIVVLVQNPDGKMRRLPDVASEEYSHSPADCGPQQHAVPQVLYPTQHRANSDRDAERLMSRYLNRAATAEDPPLHDGGSIPAGYVPWWVGQMKNPISDGSIRPVSVDWLVRSALQHSPKIRGVSTEPQIRRMMLVEESSNFDWYAFLESKYDDRNDPVGNTLTTGNNEDRFKDRIWSGDAGFRRKTYSGGEFEIGQRLGHQDNNSRFLLPNPQGTARLELSYTQPLLNGAGCAYTTRQVVLAKIDVNIAEDDFALELQDHLLKVTEAYWDLYRSRAVYLQRVQLLVRAEDILSNLRGRTEVDSLERQVLRAQAAVANRKSEIIRARTSIRNAESRLRVLVNDPALFSNRHHIVPGDFPLNVFVPISMQSSLTSALQHRPDISTSLRNLRVASVRLGVAKNELLPKLDLLVSTYAAGLAGRSRIFQAYGNQFADGRPGVGVGLQFEIPIGNRGPRAQMNRRKWEMQRALAQFQTTVEESLTEVEIAVREVQTTHMETVGKFQSMVAATKESEFLVDRWKTLPGSEDSAALLLEDLLDSQERVADEESAFVQAQVKHAIALVNMQKAMGTLLQMNTSPPQERESSSTNDAGQALGPNLELSNVNEEPLHGRVELGRNPKTKTRIPFSRYRIPGNRQHR